jgi:hypothetical protein
MRFAVVCLLLVSCRGKANREDCTQMIEHYLDLVIAEDPELAKMPPKQLAAVREMKRELKLGERSYKKVKDRCEAEVTKNEARCALDASTPKEWEECIR